VADTQVREAEMQRLRETLVRAMLRDGTLHPGPVEAAFRNVPRHAFLPDVDSDFVYRDTNIPTKLQGGEIVSASSQPAIMAIMLEQLAAAPGHTVLEVGAGAGYNAALLAEIVGRRGHVVSIDIDADIVERARAGLCRAGYAHVRVEQADGEGGFADAAPYDRIIATVGMGDIPTALWSQLKLGGQLVIPLSLRGAMKSVALRKDRSERLVSTSLMNAMFMPLRGIAPLLVREVRLGPELGLYAWSADRALNTAALYATLQDGDFEDVSTDIQLNRRELRLGLNLWLRAHLSEFVQIHAEGALADSARLPPFTRSQWAHPAVRDRVSVGVWQSGELALLMADSDQAEVMRLGVRAWGGRRLADRLVECVSAWRAEGSPTDEDLHLQLIPNGLPSTAEATIRMSAGTLELTWRKGG
jgi:protein-L-isoaspartate(D-aspartate) O-methyltransferase